MIMVRVLTERVANSSSGNNMSNSSHTEETGFDINTLVVPATLLSTLIAALALNSIIHYALKSRRALLDAEVAMAEGLEKHTIRKLPVDVFRLKTDVLVAECSICLGDFVDGEKLRVLPECNHEFHVKCVDKWLVGHMSCPNCRHLMAVPSV